MDLVKLLFSSKPEVLDDFEEVEYEGDVRAIIISQKLEYDLAEKEAINSMSGKFKYYYQKTLPLQSIVLVLIVLVALFQKPQWCVKRGAEMKDDCSETIDGETKYFLMNSTFLSPRASFILSFLLMYFMLIL